MCAIFGMIGENVEVVKSALNLMQHRGNDYSDIKTNKKYTFGFNRLAIENLEINNQPLKIEDKLFVFNGEIYNYKELIKKYNLNVKTEIEVIAKLWEKFGVEFVKYLDGMFAIAIYDKKLYLFRDEFGKKPLYFTKNAFSSEINPLLKIVKKEINLNALSEYFAYNSSIAPNTIYKGIFKLPAGCYFDGEIKRWHDFEMKNEKCKMENEKVIFNIENLLTKSIEKRLMGDVEIGSLLSGGVDSSLIVALALKYKKIDTFSIGYEGFENYDERKYAKVVANHLGIKNFDFVLTKKKFYENFENVLDSMQEPISDSSFFAAYELAKNIPLKVVLSGEGSDELFLGYRRYDEFLEFFKSYLPNKKWLKKYLERYPEDIKEWEIFRRFFNDEDVFRGINETFFDRQIKRLLKKNAKEVEYKRFLKGWRSFDFTYFDLKVWVGEVLLSKLDKMFMAHSIEARSPFLDKNLVNFVFSMSEEIRGNKKWIIKEIAKKYLPKEIVYRRKKGFALPFYEWLKEENELKRIIDINRKTKLLNEEYLKEIIKTGHKRYKQHIWALYLFSRWVEKEFL
ncbi:asparagine synthase (glutamine-hydrolyzing) [Caminibacter mediatlanticus TB-2]|uniref:asparagine synthase (glutamine-hydrolyzing) n=1 Tax=Caminibacter mediatlanticus TB-2 TaxID=391592 RepID=A0ABX5V9D9_9BACT|nr:asparagine synthase (glutamine-hydrolyzing) [Caminibacter mediatlanticus]QCT94816.1 asparagine synthase (glutamine-hydrolyzing) [Caminibacter mediatlanticus TB-2]